MCLVCVAAVSLAQAEDYAVYRVFSTARIRLVVPGDAETPAYCKSRSGDWVRLPSSRGPQPGTSSLDIEPSQTKGGRTLIVINKPDWVELNDSVPPAVVSASLNGLAVEASQRDIKLAGVAPGDVIEMVVRDNANRISLRKTRATFDAKPAALKAARDGADPKQATLAFVVPDTCRFGAHSLILRAGDEAPEENVVERRFTFTRFGVEISKKGQEVKLHTSGATYTSTGRDLISVPFIGPRALRVAMTGKGGFMHTEKFKSKPKLVVDERDRKVVRVNPSLYLKKAAKPSTDYDCVLELEIRRDFPGLLVTSRATATCDLRQGYKFWSEFRSRDHYIGSDGKRYEWHTGYADIKPQRWVFLSPPVPSSTGYGVISSGTLGEYLGECLLIFTKPKRHKNLKAGDAIEVKFAVVPASGPDAVAAFTEQVSDWLKD